MRKQRWRKKKRLCKYCKNVVDTRDYHGYHGSKVFHISCVFEHE